VERLKNDDQLAAVLAEAVAFTLQRQGPKIKERLPLWLAEDAAVMAVWPVLGLEMDLGGEEKATKALVKMEEQRGRIALALLADAGYDPWQAPEAWRLLAPKHLPRNLDSLKYPSRSGYQLGILNLQYKKTTNAARAATQADVPPMPH